ncbi:MAG TPA: M48 family metallopeptidase [Planctomycetaceae bacterium]|nr:M48 family metallopeptidase [Planctomycetaceae bacterium]
MATDFFAQQDAARRKTGLLVFYFLVATVLIVAGVYLIVAGALVYAGQRQQREPGGPQRVAARTLWDPLLLAGVTGGTLAVIFGGSLYKVAALNAGGESVASLLGGRRLDPDTAAPDERRLLNVVEEMAIASGTPVPTVFLLEDEPGINAFAAGYTPGDAVIGVTRGTLEYLTRDELQGVVAHEFSHILNGDMRLNIRLIGILHGILLIALIGYVLVRSAGLSSRASRRRSKDGGGAAGILAAGVALIVIGYIGVFFGRLIKSAVSRQREFLADASAVQFTRNPEGIGGALKKIGGVARGSRIEDGHAEEASHMFFGNALGAPLLSLLATHPPLTVRIKRIEPGFDGKFPRIEPLRERQEPERTSASKPAGGRVPLPLPPILPGAMAAGRMPIDPVAVLAMIGTVQDQHLAYARTLLDSLPQELRAAAHQPRGAQALIYGLLLDDDVAVREVQDRHLQANAPPEVRDEVRRLWPALGELPAAARVPLVELTFPALRVLPPEEYGRFRANVEALVKADRRLALFEYTLRRMLLRHLDSHFANRKPAIVQYYALRPLLPDCAALLSSLAHVGHPEVAEAAQAFASGVAVLRADGGAIQLLPREQCGLKAVDEALSRLALAAPQIKKRILTAALACIAADRRVTLAEGELLQAIADSLDCPMPPLLGVTPPAATGFTPASR